MKVVLALFAAALLTIVGFNTTAMASTHHRHHRPFPSQPHTIPSGVWVGGKVKVGHHCDNNGWYGWMSKGPYGPYAKCRHHKWRFTGVA